MKLYIQQTDINYLARTVSRVHFSGLHATHISSKPRDGFVEFEPAIPRCKTCKSFSGAECVHGDGMVEAGIDSYCSAHSDFDK
jgi:hypothetical protein